MKEVVVRFRIPESLVRRYRIACLKKGLTGPKQLAQLIANFVESFEVNEPYIKEK